MKLGSDVFEAVASGRLTPEEGALLLEKRRERQGLDLDGVLVAVVVIVTLASFLVGR